MIYILKDEFKYVNEKAGQEEASTGYGYYCHTGQWCRIGRPTCLGDKSRTQGGDLIRQTPLEDPNEGIRTTDRCVVLHRSEAKEGDYSFELSFKC